MSITSTPRFSRVAASRLQLGRGPPTKPPEPFAEQAGLARRAAGLHQPVEVDAHPDPAEDRALGQRAGRGRRRSRREPR